MLLKKATSRYCVIFALAIFSQNMVYGQSELKIEKSKDFRLVKVLSSSRLLSETKTSNLSIRVFMLDNGYGSAGLNNSEVSHTILISVSEFDELPEQNLFEVGPMYNPKFKEWIIDDTKSGFKIEYGFFKKTKTVLLYVNIDKVSIDNG